MAGDGDGRVKAAWLQVVKHVVNPVTMRIARSGRGPFVLVRYVGRTSGRTYETPLLLGRAPDGFVTELTYGPHVQWYRNVVAAGGCTIVRGAKQWEVGAPRPLDAATGLAAFPPNRRVLLRVLRRREFRLLPFVRPPAL